MVIVVEISLITPPIGLDVFVLKALHPEVPIPSIYKGILPFLLADLLRLGLLVAVPGLVLVLVN
jgi:TRAP-type C4-dicarboxylate transport system permease large subunit